MNNPAASLRWEAALPDVCSRLIWETAALRLHQHRVSCDSKLTTHFCTPAALHPFVDMALQYFPEIHIFTSADGINNYQWALIQPSPWISAWHTLSRHFKCHFSDKFHNNVWHECTKTAAAMTQTVVWWSIYQTGMKGSESSFGLLVHTLTSVLLPSSRWLQKAGASFQQQLPDIHRCALTGMQDIFKGLVTQARACRLLPGMTQFGVGLEIIYSCDMILAGCYLEEKDLQGQALLGSLENTNSLLLVFHHWIRKEEHEMFLFCLCRLFKPTGTELWSFGLTPFSTDIFHFCSHWSWFCLVCLFS